MDKIHRKPIEEHVPVPRVNVSKENTAPLEKPSPVPVPHIIEDDRETVPKPTSTPCNNNNYSKKITPNIIPDDRPQHK